jgi:hypothetical protein
VLYFASNPTEPTILPEILTEGILAEALKKAP